MSHPSGLSDDQAIQLETLTEQLVGELVGFIGGDRHAGRGSAVTNVHDQLMLDDRHHHMSECVVRVSSEMNHGCVGHLDRPHLRGIGAPVGPPGSRRVDLSMIHVLATAVSRMQISSQTIAKREDEPCFARDSAALADRRREETRLHMHIGERPKLLVRGQAGRRVRHDQQ